MKPLRFWTYDFDLPLHEEVHIARAIPCMKDDRIGLVRLFLSGGRRILTQKYLLEVVRASEKSQIVDFNFKQVD